MSKKLTVLAAIYAAAAILTLSVYAFVAYRNLDNYRYAAKYSSQHSVEETVASVRSLSTGLKKSAYAVDGSICSSICAKACADALSAQAALSVLPFSTQELEQISGFLGTTGDYTYTLCAEASQQGFTTEQKKTLANLSDTAASLASSLEELQGDMNDKLLTMDSDELRLRNVGVEDTEKLSTRLLGYEAAFPQQKKIEYDGKYGASEKEIGGELTDTQMLSRAAEFAGVGLGELKSEFQYEEADGRRCFSAGDTQICVSRRGVESLSQTRLVSDVAIEQEKAEETAARYLNAHGYDSVEMISSQLRGALLHTVFATVREDALCVDDTLSVTVAMDDGSVYSFNAENYSGGGEALEWLISEEQAQEKLPEGLSLEGVRKTVIKSAGGRDVASYALRCMDGESPLTIYVDAQSGHQCRIDL